jgi:hypothetical protein
MKILMVKLSPIESIDSATIRTLALTRGLIGQQCVIDYLAIPTSSNHVISGDEYLFQSINVIRSKSNSRYEAVIKNNGSFKKRIVDLLRKIYHILSLYDYTYSISKDINISILKNTKYDLIISSSDPKTSHIAVKKLIEQGLSYKKWIQYWGDPMALDITNKSIYPKWYIAKIEKNLISKADKIVYVSPFTLEEQKKLFPCMADKMCFLPIPYINEKIYAKTNNDKYIVGYFGAYESNVRDIMPLYKAGLKLKDIIKLNIVGNSDIFLQTTENINIYPRGNISEFEKNADLLVCVLNKKGTQIPGKLYHSAATNKPVLVIIDGDNTGEMKQYLESFNRFVVCENKEANIVTAISCIISNNKHYSPSPQFSADTIARSFLNLMKEEWV